jgi:hypothetical protein
MYRLPRPKLDVMDRPGERRCTVLWTRSLDLLILDARSTIAEELDILRCVRYSKVGLEPWLGSSEFIRGDPVCKVPAYQAICDVNLQSF